MVTSNLRPEAAYQGAKQPLKTILKVQSGLRISELFFGAICIPIIKEFLQMDTVKSHKFGRYHLPNVWILRWLFIHRLVSLFRCFLAKVRNNMRELLTIPHSAAIYFDFAC